MFCFVTNINHKQQKMKYIYQIIVVSLFSYSCTQNTNQNYINKTVNKDSIFIAKSAQNAIKGRAIFNKHCSACHNIESCSGINFRDIFKIYKSMRDDHLFEKILHKFE